MACWAPGSRRSPVRTAPGIAPSSFGRHQIGVRGNTVSPATSGAIVGTSCTAEAPVPITATRLPRSCTDRSQRAVCTVAPAKSSRPGMSGGLGLVSTPVAPMT